MSLLSLHLALQHKSLIFCGSLLASLQCGRVVWITSPICESAGFRRPPFSWPLKSRSVFCLEVSPCGQHLCSLLAVGRASIREKEEAFGCPVLRCAEKCQYGRGCCSHECLGHRYELSLHPKWHSFLSDRYRAGWRDG